MASVKLQKEVMETGGTCGVFTWLPSENSIMPVYKIKHCFIVVSSSYIISGVSTAFEVYTANADSFGAKDCSSFPRSDGGTNIVHAALILNCPMAL